MGWRGARSLLAIYRGPLLADGGASALASRLGVASPHQKTVARPIRLFIYPMSIRVYPWLNYF